MGLIKVTVHAADPFTLTGLKVMLRHLPQVVVVNATEAGAVDVVVVAVERLSGAGQQLLRAAAAAGRAPVVLIANEIEDGQLLLALQCQVVSIVSRATADENRLRHAILTAARGESDLCSPAGPENHSAELSMREVDVVRLMAEGLDTYQIGEELGYSERTIKNIIYAFTTRVQLRNRPHAVSYALRTGVIW
ncbi:response regulator transcription factor [Kribbella antibiotica]|uniref:Response regulator transcription factor n=1 Tax=Kribbella antibiotica TaxID=190195 RepID=A0A4R4ZTW7_9ACTN|nr:LuxR C-terminal-related transcriptional regulator [Kribbella antibiotica]TDD61399.1 response regulator transcription factor [Kribbella antibiotica]